LISGKTYNTRVEVKTSILTLWMGFSVVNGNVAIPNSIISARFPLRKKI
jgi:hypothetical protein